MKNRGRNCPALLLIGLLAGVSMAAATKQDPVEPGEFVIENPTLINLGFEWFIRGDDNRNAKVAPAFQKGGDGMSREQIRKLTSLSSCAG